MGPFIFILHITSINICVINLSLKFLSMFDKLGFSMKHFMSLEFFNLLPAAPTVILLINQSSLGFPKFVLKVADLFVHSDFSVFKSFAGFGQEVLELLNFFFQLLLLCLKLGKLSLKGLVLTVNFFVSVVKRVNGIIDFLLNSINFSLLVLDHFLHLMDILNSFIQLISNIL